MILAVVGAILIIAGRRYCSAQDGRDLVAEARRETG